MISSFGPRKEIVIDPLRIIEAIVVGISFLGVGTILMHTRPREKTVEDVTTSASILSVSAIGVAVAVDALILAVGATLLDLFINWALYSLLSRANPNSH